MSRGSALNYLLSLTHFVIRKKELFPCSRLLTFGEEGLVSSLKGKKNELLPATFFFLDRLIVVSIG